MKAIVQERYGSPDVLWLEEVEKPVPADNEVLVRIDAAVVTPPDCAFRKAEPSITRLFNGLLRPKISILGGDFAGVIEAIGNNTTRFKTGDQVYGTSASFGAHAEYICLPEHGGLALMPDNMTCEEAVALSDGALTALPFLRDHGQVRKGQNVLINGASGSVGAAAVQLAKYFGAEVTGVSSTMNLDLVRSLGADKVIDYTQQDFTRTGETYDVIFDAVGKSSFSRCKASLKQRGIYLTTVLSAAIPLQMLWTARFRGKQAIIALTGLRSPEDKANDLAFLGELAEAGMIRPVIDRRYSLGQIADAHRHVETGHKKGSVVVVVDHDGH
jgi:NADPH:quinone reductase-like Zn-dependent oxidoreductase